jgi:hypothetical protein
MKTYQILAGVKEVLESRFYIKTWDDGTNMSISAEIADIIENNGNNYCVEDIIKAVADQATEAFDADPEKAERYGVSRK